MIVGLHPGQQPLRTRNAQVGCRRRVVHPSSPTVPSGPARGGARVGTQPADNLVDVREGSALHGHRRHDADDGAPVTRGRRLTEQFLYERVGETGARGVAWQGPAEYVAPVNSEDLRVGSWGTDRESRYGLDRRGDERHVCYSRWRRSRSERVQPNDLLDLIRGAQQHFQSVSEPLAQAPLQAYAYRLLLRRGGLEPNVARCAVRGDSGEPQSLESLTQLGHLDRLATADVDASKKCHVSRHRPASSSVLAGPKYSAPRASSSFDRTRRGKDTRSGAGFHFR